MFEASDDQQTCMDAFDAFPRYEREEKEEAEKQPVTSKTKTIWFYIICLVGVLVITAFYALTPTTISITETEPTYDTFLTFEKHNPTCKCTKSNIAYSVFATLGISSDSVCTTTNTLLKMCTDTTGGSPLDTNICSSSKKSFFDVIGGICKISSDLMVIEKTQFNATRLTSSELLRRVVTIEIIDNAGQSRSDSIKNLLYIPIIAFSGMFRFENPVTWTATNTFGVGGGTAAIAVTGNQTKCITDGSHIFRSTLANGDGSFACSRLYQLLGNTLSQIQQTSFYPSLPNSNAEITTFVNTAISGFTSSSFPATTTLEQMVRGGMASNVTKLTTTDYKAYYETCAPSDCVYTVTRTKLPAEIFATLIGLVGGVATVAAFFVDKMLPAMCKKCCGKDIEKEDDAENLVEAQELGAGAGGDGDGGDAKRV